MTPGATRTIDEVCEVDRARSQGPVIEVDHATLGPIELPGPAVRFECLDGTAPGRAVHVAPPRLDADVVGVRRLAAGFYARSTGRVVDIRSGSRPD